MFDEALAIVDAFLLQLIRTSARHGKAPAAEDVNKLALSPPKLTAK